MSTPPAPPPPAAPVLVDIYAAAAHARLTHNLQLAPATIRQWLSRGHLTRHPHTANGLAVVDLNELDHRLTTRQQTRRRACRAALTSPRRGHRGQPPPAGGPPMQPQLVQYMLNDYDVRLITAQHRSQLDAGTMNAPSAGETYPAVVVRTWHGGLLNLQVLLDGNVAYWATSRPSGTTPGTWSTSTPTDQDEPAPWQAIMLHFRHRHLPEPLQEISAQCSALALDMVKQLPDDPELLAGLRCLLQAKDCFVRAAAQTMDHQR